MITFTNIIAELENRGFKAHETSTVKNGVKFEGITVMITDNCGFNVYKQDINDLIRKGYSLAEIVNKIENTFEKNKTTVYHTEDITDVEKILANCFVAFQRVSDNNNLVKRAYNDQIEMYIRVSIPEKEGSYKITKYLLESVGLEENTLWDSATKNTIEDAQIFPIGNFTGINAPMFILTNQSTNWGAGSLIATDLIKDFAEKEGIKKIVVLPSSIHETILVNADYGTIELFSQMVKDVNANNVEEFEQLANDAFILEF